MELALLFGGDSGALREWLCFGRAVASSRRLAKAVVERELEALVGGEAESWEGETKEAG